MPSHTLPTYIDKRREKSTGKDTGKALILYIVYILYTYKVDWIRGCRSISDVLREQSACAHSCYGVNYAYICQEQQENAARVHPNRRRTRLRGKGDGVILSRSLRQRSVTLNITSLTFFFQGLLTCRCPKQNVIAMTKIVSSRRNSIFVCQKKKKKQCLMQTKNKDVRLNFVKLTMINFLLHFASDMYRSLYIYIRPTVNTI